jgi:hypothetical protein
VLEAQRRRLGRLYGRPDLVPLLRRHAEERLDQAMTGAYHRFGFSRRVPCFQGETGLAMVTVNYSTTQFLKLMLCTLAEQWQLSLLQRLVIVDNGSRDGGLPFLRALAEQVPHIHLAERRHLLNHAAGMRAGIRVLERAERADPAGRPAGMVVFCDPDVVFRNPATLQHLAAAMTQSNAAFAGEARQAPPAHPDVQASFFAVRRDAMARRDVQPLVNHGSPAYGMQASMRRAGLTIANFPSNHGGYVLHRGRTAVAAGARYGVGGWALAVTNREPHFMGVPDGARIWAGVQDRWAWLMEPTAEQTLLGHLERRFAGSSRFARMPGSPAERTDPPPETEISEEAPRGRR